MASARRARKAFCAARYGLPVLPDSFACHSAAFVGWPDALYRSTSSCTMSTVRPASVAVETAAPVFLSMPSERAAASNCSSAST